ncbi:MAG TPA: nucleotidyltransferase domain-containing protein [Patescibacteria group bacterium]|nr:nucleotidyltransferase domain-containing protein [Patescibacteria group bacterium]
MAKDQAIKIVKNYARKLRAGRFPAAQVYLFGSFAKNTAHEDSDIDVAVVSDKLSKLENSFWLRRIRREVDLRIEPHSFTVRDFKNETSPLVAEIKKYGIRV